MSVSQAELVDEFRLALIELYGRTDDLDVDSLRQIEGWGSATFQVLLMLDRAVKEAMDGA